MAADKLVDSTQLDGAMNATADAIRNKIGSGTDGDMTWDLNSGFTERIGDIVTLVEGTTGDDAISSDILIGKKAHTFNGTPITGTIPLLAGATINLKTTDQTILAGSYISGKQTIRGVSISNTVSASNVRSGVSIKIGDTGSATRFKNFTGTYTSESTSPAANETILSGKIAYVNGTKLTGNIETLTASNITVNGKTIIIPVHKYTGTSSASPITKSIADGDYSADSSTSTNSTVTPSLSITNSSTYGFTTTKPTSGTYQTLTPGFSASAWSVTPRANITTAGYLDVDSKTGDAVTNTPTSGTVTPYYIPVVTPTFGGGALSETKNTNTLIDTPEVTVSASGTFTTKTGYGVTQAKPSGTDGTAYLTINGSGSVTTVGKATSEYGVSRAGVTYSNNPGAIASHTNAAATLSAAASKTGTKDVSITPSVVNNFNPYYIPIVTASFGGGTLSESVNTNQITTTPVVTVSASGTFTTKTGYGVTQTKPSGTDGTAYLTIDGGGSVTTEGKATSNYTVTRANVTYTNSAGAIAAHSSTTATLSASASKSGSKEVAITPEVVDSFDPYYIPIVTASFGGGTLSKTDFTKNDLALTLEDGADNNVINYTVGAKDTTNYPYYVKVSGSTPAVSGTTSVSRAAVTYSNNAGAIAKHTNTTATLSAAASASPSVSVNATSGDTYVGFKKATMTVAGTNTVSPTADVAGSENVTLGTTNNGIAVTATGGGTASVTATATTNVAGYAPASTQLGSGTLSAPSNTTTQTKYITAITVPASKSLTVTNNGTVPMTNSGSTTITSESNGNGSSVKVAAYSLESSTTRTSKDVVSNGRWVTTDVTANGTYFGRVVVPQSTTTNPATLPSGTNSVQISRGNYLKIGAGFVNTDTYYLAQANSGTLALTQGGTTNCDGYAAVNAPIVVPQFSGGTLSGGSTAVGTNCTINTTANNGITIQTKYSGASTDIIYSGNVNGWVTKADNDQALSGKTLSSRDGTCYYLTKVTVPSDVGFSVTTTADSAGELDTTSDLDVANYAYRRVDVRNYANGSVIVTNTGSAKITSASNNNASSVNIAAYATDASTSRTTKDVVTNGHWITTDVTASGTFYGRVVVPAGTATNPATLPSGGSSTQITRGNYIKIGAGFYNNDVYYRAQPNSGTYGITSSNYDGNGGNITVDGYQYATVSAAESSTNAASASITTSSSDSTSITLDETQPSGVNYYTLTANGSGSSKITTAGWIKAGALETTSTTKPYYVTKGVISNNQSSGTSSGTVNRGKKIKIGKGYYPADLYYTAQANSGTVTISGSGNTTCDGYVTASVVAASSDADTAAASITTASSDSTSITLAETQPSGGNYYTLTANGSGNSKVISAGWIAAGSLATASTTKNYYVTKGVISNNQSSGTSSGTINRGKKIKIGKGYYPADLYYTAQANSGTVTISKSGDTSCDGKVTVTVPAATPAFDGGTLSGGSTAVGTNCAINTTANNGITIQTKYSGASTDVLYNGAVNGWVTMADNAQALAGKTLSSTNGTLYYLTGVNVPSDAPFSLTTIEGTDPPNSSAMVNITNNSYRILSIQNRAHGIVSITNTGSVDVWSYSNGDGSYVNVHAYDTESSSSLTSVAVVSNGRWFSPSVAAAGTYYGRVVVPSATPAFKGGALNSQGATITSTNATVSTSSNNSGVTITAKGTAGRAAVTYNGAVSGFVKVSNGATASAAVSAATWDGTTYYLNGVELTAGKTFTITVPNGSASNKINFVFHVDNNNNVTVTET